MPRQTVEIEITSTVSFEGASKFFSFLAYPQPEDESRRELFETALCRRVLSIMGAIDGIRHIHFPIRPALFAGSETAYQKALKQGLKQVHNRYAVGHFVVLPHLLSLERLQGFSTDVNNLINLLTKDIGWNAEGQSDSTAKTKIWKPSWPVAHAAAAFVAVTNYFAPQYFDEQRLEAAAPPIESAVMMFLNSEWLQVLIKEAEEYRLQVTKIEHFKKIREPDTIQFLAVHPRRQTETSVG